MIIFKKIRWRNFLSTGNVFTEIDITKSNTNLIVGTNGAGKSTILDALTFVLYNKPFRKISKTQLVNSVNEKACLVEIEFDISNKQYKVVRGIKPNRFEIHIDGKLQDQSSATTDQQKSLEENILKLNYKSFTQTVILGSATFVPFMQLSAANRRDIVEDLLDIRIFSGMGSLLKERIRSSNEVIRELSIKRDLVEEKIVMQKQFIDDLDKKGKANIASKESKVSELLDLADELVSENSELSKKIVEEYQPQLESLGSSSASLKKMNSIKAKLEQKIQTITNEHKFFNDNTVCPTCDQAIEEEFRVNRIGEIESKVKEINSAYKELKVSITEEQEKETKFLQLSKQITSLNYDISTNNTKITEYQRQSRDLEIEIQEITSQIENRNAERSTLKKLESDLKGLEKQKSTNTENISYLNFAHSLMKDSGVKSKIIKRYLPVMNQYINKYLQMMDFFVNFTLDEEFKEVIKSRFRDEFSYASFSEGEKQKIDLALLFTWREVARMKNSVATNLLILDEVFDSSLDASATGELLAILRSLGNGTNLFVISHKGDILVDKFLRTLRFEKVNDFSKMSDES